ncbi:PREDICTED: proton-coupled amino acid transporter 4-like [Papilio xuthus]|uniref:Proton-coupled amino acid transporter 4 n=1 Tax=Papilio xuthus TaxID=66420 RepID=A0A194PJ29_PAPXU|nr:PREDICTED: proton-coupled amino acid transporter 4-like [Papilio xuthus]XP_013161816.1 PREDICTED: proton-coupled amino acid transporter 4-like [Papilio xuthus]XP_013161817.1 PREDICTED: proton-coupled amino acid transporter 4-like [Papilio xuthus]XP_013161818.1 PREDICTED: proton-coupled amino acid transporter 4-like [Papilio xuthus]KPI91090.1 Proton-coupled amino acid transporter 4 [Papilio xuthus]
MKKEPEIPPIRTVQDAYSSKIELAYNGSREDLDPYVPAEHRPSESNTSSFGALAHLLKASLGSGVLAMPLAFKNAGLLVGLIGTLIIGFICGHVIHVLVKTSQQLCVEVKKPSLGYADTCDLVFQNGPKPVRKFAPFARELADWALAVTHLGACCVYTVVVAESFKQVSDVYGGPNWSVTVYCGLTLVVLIPLTQISTLKYLVPFSALANFVWLGSICISIYYCLRDPPKISERNLATSITGIPNFISTSLFAMEGIGVVMPVENEMSKPQHFLGCPGVLNIAMSAVAVLYGFVGFAGYLNFGEEVRGSLTLNLPQDEILAQTAKILVACVMLLSFALVYYVPVDVVWRRVQDRIPARGHRWGMAALRFIGTVLIVGVASAIPKLELFMELVGAVCLSVMGLLLPAIVETVWLWGRDLGPCNWILWKNCLIGIFSIIAMVSGVAYSIISLLEHL